ncbi:MAG TPA: hypothetical protein DHD79_01105 [Firmicutes bacterium]|jgi:hypothetical protein|nr:hypothetical protein [Bacillota bacterium]HAW70426.1 hypothetical protein [Bacillota bacterium]HAZ21510.1 hypothetical protein [Bacillota bacterium]HBE05644.1 hypothetical protein [Bacillota bacterium]HBG45186.1 hypothetical protein [Bacillota bacterium]
MRDDFTVKTERLKTLKVVGEGIAQVVVENEVYIDAIKIDKIDATLGPTEDHVFHNKVVKQGTIHKQIFFVDSNNFVRHMAEDIPFMVTVEIPGVRPSDYIEVQNHLIDVETDFQLIPVTNVPDDDNNNGHLAVLRQKVVAHVLVKVSEWTQIDVVTDVIPSRMLVLGKDHKCSCSSTKVIC